MNKPRNYTTLGILVLLFLCPAAKASDHFSSFRTAEGLWTVRYDVSGDKLNYAVIQGPARDGITGVVFPSWSTWEEPKAIFKYPNGKQIDLYGSGRVFYVTEDIVAESMFKIDAATLKAFLDSKPKDLRLPALIKFAKDKSRETDKKKIAEQGDAVQPATAADSKSEGKKKAKPESEGRCQ